MACVLPTKFLKSMHGGKSVWTKEGLGFVTSPVLEGSFPTTLVSFPPSTPTVQTLGRQCGVKDMEAHTGSTPSEGRRCNSKGTERGRLTTTFPSFDLAYVGTLYLTPIKTIGMG